MKFHITRGPYWYEEEKPCSIAVQEELPYRETIILETYYEELPKNWYEEGLDHKQEDIPLDTLECPYERVKFSRTINRLCWTVEITSLEELLNIGMVMISRADKSKFSLPTITIYDVNE